MALAQIPRFPDHSKMPGPSGFVPYLNANPNGFAETAFSVIRVANIAVCLLTAVAMIGGAMASNQRR